MGAADEPWPPSGEVYARKHTIWDAIRPRLGGGILAGTILAIAIAVVCHAEPERKASAYVYHHGKRILPQERSQAIIKEMLAPLAGHHGPGNMEATILIDMRATDPLIRRVIWPHAAGVDTVWYGEIPEPNKGQRNYVAVGREGRSLPDSITVETTAWSLTLPVERER